MIDFDNKMLVCFPLLVILAGEHLKLHQKTCAMNQDSIKY